MKKVLLIILVIIVLVIVVGVALLGYLGFIPAIAHLFGSDKPRDLGVVWTATDYNQGHAKTKVTVVSATGDVSPKESLQLTGSHAAKLNLSSPEITAIINTNSANWKYFPVTNVQVRIGADGFAQVSGMLNFDRLSGYSAATGANYANIQLVMDKFKLMPAQLPFYIAGTATATNNTASLNLNQVELGRAPVPSNYLTDYKAQIDGFFTQQLNAFPGFSVKTASLLGGNINFDGTLSDRIVTYK